MQQIMSIFSFWKTNTFLLIRDINQIVCSKWNNIYLIINMFVLQTVFSTLVHRLIIICSSNCQDIKSYKWLFINLINEVFLWILPKYHHFKNLISSFFIDFFIATNFKQSFRCMNDFRRCISDKTAQVLFLIIEPFSNSFAK